MLRTTPTRPPTYRAKKVNPKTKPTTSSKQGTQPPSRGTTIIITIAVTISELDGGAPELAQERPGAPTGEPRSAQERPGAPRSAQEHPGAPRSAQERPGAPRSAQERQERPGAPRSAQERQGAPRSAQAAQTSPGSSKRPPGRREPGSGRLLKRMYKKRKAPEPGPKMRIWRPQRSRPEGAA